MKVIETAKIIAARINLLFGAEGWFMSPPFAVRKAIPPSGGLGETLPVRVFSPP
jgi:hypothetical protein